MKDKNSGIKIFIAVIFFAALFPFVSLAGTYTTTISPSGLKVVSPIIATFDIQDFSEKDYPIPGTGCMSSFVPAEIHYNYWFDEGTNFSEISPPVIPTAEEISSGIYQATLNLPVGVEVWGIGAEFYSQVDGGGTRCGFYGNQPDGVPIDWTALIFTVIKAPPETISVSVPVRPQNNNPQIITAAFPQEAVWLGKKIITYTALDFDAPPYHLKDLPMSFSLSADGGNTWLEIEKDAQNTGEFIFNTDTFPDGANYKLKITATDNAGLAGTIISNTFRIDNSPPTFEVKIDTDLIKETDKINLSIVSSEDLKQAPEIEITQNGADAQTLSVMGSRKNFSAPFAVLRGFSGSAVISVKGEDLSGNAGEEIISGGTFFVNRFGPPPPMIENLTDNESINTPNFNILGTAPEAKEVFLILNQQKFSVKPDSEGNFIFKNFELSEANRGFNTLKISGIDKDGIESLEKTLTLKLNSPPEISLTKALSGILSGKKEVVWNASDTNGDDLNFEVSYSVDGGKTWDFLARGIIERKYELDTDELFDGDNYKIKIAASDGTTESDVVSEKFSILNRNLFQINIPVNLLMNFASPLFEGSITLSKGRISSVRYSLDKEVWFAATPSDKEFDADLERYSLRFREPLLDGRHSLFMEIKDEQDFAYRTFRPFIIDTAPPLASKITSLPAGEIISSKADENSTLGGIQLTISGLAEAGADIRMSVNNRFYNTSASSRGEFIFKEVTFLSRGVNRYSLFSTDAVGNISEVSGIIISNNSPSLSITSLSKGDFVGGTKEIKWNAFDEDADELVFSIFYRKEGGSWRVVADNLSVNSFSFDTFGLDGGQYNIRVTANDGLSEVSEIVEGLIVDNVRPEIKLDFSGPLSVGKILPLFSGSALDNLSGIRFIEYSIDGKTWFKGTIIDGFLEKKAFFAVRQRLELEDGEYDFGVRAIDAAGNISRPIFEKIIVDAAPPRIGSFALKKGGLGILPEGKMFRVPVGSRLKFALSLEKDAKSADLHFSITSDPVSLVKSDMTGLWEADLIFPEKEEHSEMLVSAEDFSGNRTEDKKIGQIEVARRGQTEPSSEITVFERNPEDRALYLWRAEAFNLQNPIESDEHGGYELFLPVGRWQILVRKIGFERLRTSDFELSNPGFINFDFKLNPRTGVRGFFEDLFERFRIGQ